MHKKEKGNIGEYVACKHLINKGFKILARNYQRSWGELDIIAEKDKCIHFFEVKSATFLSSNDLNGHKPEDNVHGLKVKRIRRMIETYIVDNKYAPETPFQFHILCVFMDMNTRKGKVRVLENIIL